MIPVNEHFLDWIVNTEQQGYYCFIINYIHWGFYIEFNSAFIVFNGKKTYLQFPDEVVNDLLEWFRENNYDISYYANVPYFYDSVWTVKMDEIQVIEFRMKWL